MMNSTFALKRRYYFWDIIHQRLAFSMIPKQQIGEHKVNYQDKRTSKISLVHPPSLEDTFIYIAHNFIIQPKKLKTKYL
jgi:hypothetical protein